MGPGPLASLLCAVSTADTTVSRTEVSPPQRKMAHITEAARLTRESSCTTFEWERENHFFPRSLPIFCLSESATSVESAGMQNFHPPQNKTCFLCLPEHAGEKTLCLRKQRKASLTSYESPCCISGARPASPLLSEAPPERGVAGSWSRAGQPLSWGTQNAGAGRGFEGVQRRLMQ